MAEEQKQGAMLTTSKFSEYVIDMYDLYTLADRNDYNLKAEKLSAECEVMILKILQGVCWCAKYDQIKLKNCERLPNQGSARSQANGDLRPREIQHLD